MHRQQLLKETLFEKNSSTILTFCAKMKPVTGILNITGNDNSNFILQDQIQDYCQSNISAYINFEITVSPGSKLKLAPFFFFLILLHFFQLYELPFLESCINHISFSFNILYNQNKGDLAASLQVQYNAIYASHLSLCHQEQLLTRKKKMSLGRNQSEISHAFFIFENMHLPMQEVLILLKQRKLSKTTINISKLLYFSTAMPFL